MMGADGLPAMRSRMWSRVAALALITTGVGAASSVDARPPGSSGDGVALPAAASSPAIPESLRGWSQWVLLDHERKLCPSVPGDADDDGGEGTCLWSGRLTVALDQRGGKFSQDVDVLAPSAVPLPGGRRTWPLDVKVDGKAAVVVSDGDGDDATPVVRLGVGRHALTGVFSWRTLPESLPIPSSTGLVALTLFGRSVAFPSRSDAGTLFLQREEREIAEEEKLDIAVHRHLSDEIPALLTTRLVLNVSGKAREVVLGRALPTGFVAHALDSPLPARIEPDGRLRVQLRPGTWTIMVVARHETALTKVARPVPDGPWKEGDEVWVFVARPELRVVTVEGVATIDPQQTTLPPEWKALPAYLMTAGATMTLNQRRRGDHDPAPDQLQLRRRLWLDFDGAGFTAQDRITGTFQRGWRLSMGPESRLGRVSVNGQDQFITRVGAGGPEGVEIRQTRAVLSAESRINKARGGIPAVGWDQDFQSVSATLALPPGWMLAHASGADSVATTWIQHWTLLELFLLLVTGLGMGKVFGWRTGALALVTLALVFPQPEAPQWIWLIALVAETLVRALPAGRLRSVAIGARLGAWVVLLIAALPFAVHEVRVALHPALATQNGSRYSNDHGGGQAESPEEVEEDSSAAKAGVLAGQGTSDIADLLRDGEGVAGPGGLGAMGTSGKGGVGSRGLGNLRSARSSKAGPPATQNLTAYDPNVMVQTGPGVPKWTWSAVHLGWNGPVEKTQRLNLWLVPPAANLMLGLGRVALMAFLIVRLFGGPRVLATGLRLGRSGGPPRGAATAAALVLAVSVAAAAAPARAAEFPTEELLGKLRERLLKKPPCHPDCAAFGRLSLDATPDRLRLRLEAGAAAAATVPLPGSAQHWVPETITVDGKPGLLVRDDKGVLWTALDPGNHQIVLEGALPSRETVQIPFALVPRAVTVTAKGWKIAGLSEEGVIEGSLQLSREAASPSSPRAAGTALGGSDTELGSAAASLPPFVRVERTLNLGLKWEVRTRVVRQTPLGAAVVLEVPLLPGESVITSGVPVARGRAQVNLGAGDTDLTWDSTLTEAPQVILQAPASAAWAEVWLVNASPVWHVAFAGIPPIRSPDNTSTRVPEWRPWPGETVTVTISKPGGVVGQTLTIDEATLTLRPGIRSSSAALALALRSSRGGEHTITLPEGAAVDAVTVNGNKQPLRQEGRRLTLPINPGRGHATIAWRQPLGVSTMFRAPAVDLGLPAVNVTVAIDLASDRWILALGGPRLGPAVLFWSFVVVLVLLAAGLGQTRLAPLGVRQWILLGLGLSQTPPLAAAIVAGALLAFGWRRAHPPARRPWVHNLGQLLFAVWTVAAIAVLFAAIKQGLLEQPDMRVTGNGSSEGHLNWFADRVGGVLPQPWVVSAPLLVYRLAMLAWALWLALAVIRWARWVWDCFTHGDLWRASAKQPKTPS